MEPSASLKKNPFRLFGERKRVNNLFTTNDAQIKYKQQDITSYMKKEEPKNLNESDSYPCSVFSNYSIIKPFFKIYKERMTYSQQLNDKISEKEIHKNIKTIVKNNPFYCKGSDVDSISIPNNSLYESEEDSDHYSVDDKIKTPHTKLEPRISSPLVKTNPFKSMKSMIHSINGTVKDEFDLLEPNDALYFRRLYNRERETKMLYNKLRYPSDFFKIENDARDKHKYIQSLNSIGKRRSDVVPQVVSYLILKNTTRGRKYFTVYNENLLKFTNDSKFQSMIINRKRDIDDNTDDEDAMGASSDCIQDLNNAIMQFESKYLKVNNINPITFIHDE